MPDQQGRPRGHKCMGHVSVIGLTFLAALPVLAQQPPGNPPVAGTGAPLGSPEQPAPPPTPHQQTPNPTASAAQQGAEGLKIPSGQPAAEAFAAGPGSQSMLDVPATNLFPGNVRIVPQIDNPVAGQSEAATRGMRYFIGFNCVGCHAPNGGGGMGPSLSEGVFKFGSEPAQIYMSIYQGRPLGMPHWGQMLPSNVIWDIVAYIKSISNAPATEWGQTLSQQATTIQQVPAEFQQSASPWNQTQPFGFGQKPNEGH
jgi:cytochrome c oxidase cbb3-type subunit III